MIVLQGRHCDEFIDDPTQPECLRRFLHYTRLPAVCKLPGVKGDELAKLTEFVDEKLWAFIWTAPEPSLYATLKADAVRTIGAQREAIPAGARVRVVMASRLGDVGITPKLDTEHGYAARVMLDDLTDFSDQQERA
jgi:hypothetical protein